MSSQLPTDYQAFIHLSRYARWSEDLGRRETWEETVNRYFNFFEDRLAKIEDPKGYFRAKIEEAKAGVLALDVMPSMRCLMTAGEALEKDNVAGYNCSFVAVDHPHVFDEIMYILMCGTGVGFSAESEYVEQLPVIAKKIYPSNTTIVVEDSKIGWASAYRELVSLLYTGKEPKYDTHKVRPAGARLKTFGGRASGPQPLIDLFKFTIDQFKKAQGRRLTTVEAHDLVCKIADIVVVGGVRRSALISLSDLNDDRMRLAKSGQWWETHGHRRLANNSTAYNETPDIGIFMSEWQSLYNSKSGERGIYNRAAAKRQAAKSGRRDPNHDFGTNPCSEIILRNKQFCNLSEVVVRSSDNSKTLLRKVELAAILGTLQSTLVNFRYLSDTWKQNTEEERLLGVSLTGIMDNPMLAGRQGIEQLKATLQALKEHAISVNAKWAKALGIPQSAAITCVKPSGTVSQLVDAASGIHPRYSQHYIRTVRADIKDPLATMMVDMGFPVEPDVMKPDHTLVFSFPMQAPSTAVMRNDMTAIDQLKLWLVYQRNWCEHKPSITVYVREHEWLEVGAFVYRYFEEMSGVSFLPHSDHMYKQAPYQEITEGEYHEWLPKMPTAVDWSQISKYEKEDATTSSKELACVAGICEI
jgi:ribonucleoside-triphosphate reductase